jgi:outer membrane protein
LIAKTDVLEAQAQLDGSTAARISQEVGLASAREVLAGIIGNDASNSANCALILLLPLHSLTMLNEWVKLAQDKNPQLASARFNQTAAEQVVKEQQAGYRPTIDAVASISDRDNGTGNAAASANNGSSIAAGIELQWPFIQVDAPKLLLNKPVMAVMPHVNK